MLYEVLAHLIVGFLAFQMVSDPGQIRTKNGVVEWHKRTDPQFLGFFGSPEALLDDMFQFGRDVGIHPIEQILELLAAADIADIGQHLHLFLELVLEEAVVDPDHSLDVDASDVILVEIFRVEP